MLYTPLVRIVESNVVILKGVTAMEKVFALLDTKPHIPENDNLPEFPRMKGEVEFRDVSFSYRIGQAILNDVNFTVKPGRDDRTGGAEWRGQEHDHYVGSRASMIRRRARSWSMASRSRRTMSNRCGVRSAS